MFGAQDAAVAISYISCPELQEALRTQPDAVVLFKENRIDPSADPSNMWMDAETEEAIVRYVRQGGGWLAWHAGLASYEIGSGYIEMLKGYFRYHPDEHSIVTYTGVDQGMIPLAAPFEIVDEHYFVACEEAQTNVFLRSASRDGESIAGWAHAYGHGKVCCLAPAHLPEGLFHESTLHLLKNCLQWCVSPFACRR